MTHRFDYILDKISSARIDSHPYDHIYIENLFSDSDFEEIVSASEINLVKHLSDEALFDGLFANGYQIINFPGCITEKDTYIQWHKNRGSTPVLNNEACEGFGITLRLMQAKSSVLLELKDFINGRALQECLAHKYGIQLDQVTYDCGIQKYLDGYEISPHPDIRRKALTYMVNINPGVNSEARNHHTHYLRFTDARKYVQTFWDGNPKIDRCWVPWDWCATVKEQRNNNSLVVFQPANDTMHAVKASYDHLQGQRTQLYGNFWYKEIDCKAGPDWKQLSFASSPAKATTAASSNTIVDHMKAFIPSQIKNIVKRAIGKDDSQNVIRDRLNSK
jgi:hypothetical protein